MPFTANRDFKHNPRLFVKAEGVYYTTADGQEILDGTSGLWCSNAGHCRISIVDAIKKQSAILDFAPSFQIGSPLSFEFAERLIHMKEGFSHVFFTNSGSESVDTALKIALAYQYSRGSGTRTKFIARERSYHGVNFGGISIGGIAANRKQFNNLLNGVYHICDTHNIKHNAYSKGEPEWGIHLADDLERLVVLHDPSTIAAVIVEPLAGSTGVLIPPKGYLSRLREICDVHDILLIFDEVITGFGRLGTAFASDYFAVRPDIFTTAKGITNGTVPMGAVFCRNGIYEAFMDAPESAIELFHGYTCSGHPLACAAGLATIELYQNEGLFTRSAELAHYFQEAVHSLKGSRYVVDIRNLGMVAGIELESVHNKPTVRALEAFKQCYNKGLLVRATGDTIALSPPLIIEKNQIDFIVDVISMVLRNIS
ncbi:aminotransferase class-III family protein [Candidatus Endolissoclinum faulkneri L2]|uniref:Aminotransferase class-III family protein n=1 Tax=Candidatus Endolissoclinum faulkneri L2 TaxID=1193729 RepID=K7YFX9_9PROT|nr:aspartate aminotransferase family protein [Candidatus Endolissoclinum faulkneri]AFX98495.1 aminotransferase class-III family protein [Candidatus Endolissoclinum faulkneri L2]